MGSFTTCLSVKLEMPRYRPTRGGKNLHFSTLRCNLTGPRVLVKPGKLAVLDVQEKLMRLYEFPVVTVTKDYILGGLKQHTCVLEI